MSVLAAPPKSGLSVVTRTRFCCAILNALSHLAAAWLDVSTPEPLPDDHPLLGLPNCYITPHTAGGQRAESEALVVHFLGNLRKFTADEPLVDRVM